MAQWVTLVQTVVSKDARWLVGLLIPLGIVTCGVLYFATPLVEAATELLNAYKR